MATKRKLRDLQRDVDALNDLRNSLWIEWDRLSTERAISADIGDGQAVGSYAQRLQDLAVRIHDVTTKLREAEQARDAGVIDPERPLLEE